MPSGGAPRGVLTGWQSAISSGTHDCPPCSGSLRGEGTAGLVTLLPYRGPTVTLPLCKLFFKLGQELGPVDDVPLVGAFGDGFPLVEDLNGKTDARPVDHDDLNFGAHDETNRYRFVVFYIDMRSEGDLARVEDRLDAMNRSALNELHQNGSGKDVNALISGLLGGHPLLNAALETVRASDVEFRAHAGGKYALNQNPPSGRIVRVRFELG
jgi:hypothetical protein